MIAQSGISRSNNNPCICYDALETALNTLTDYLNKNNYKDVLFHGPRLGCGLAGGDWKLVSKILSSCLCEKGYSIFIYDL